MIPPTSVKLWHSCVVVLSTWGMGLIQAGGPNLFLAHPEYIHIHLKKYVFSLLFSPPWFHLWFEWDFSDVSLTLWPVETDFKVSCARLTAQHITTSIPDRVKCWAELMLKRTVWRKTVCWHYVLAHWYKNSIQPKNEKSWKPVQLHNYWFLHYHSSSGR